MRVLGLGFVALAVVLPAQEVLVYPEFHRPDIHGEVLPVDLTGRRREILSPAIPRNGYATFFVVVKLPRPGPYRLDVLMNPEGVLQPDLYKVWHHKLESTGEYYPDALIPAGPAFLGAIPDPENRIPGQTAASFLLDIYVPREVKPQTVRLEAVLQSGGRTDIYPLEVRVSSILIPDEDALDADHNSYSAGWLFDAYPGKPLFELIHAYHRIFYEHRGLFHQLGYGHAGRVDPNFAPRLEGSGRSKRIADWDLYNRHYGPLFDGTVFRDTRRGPHPIRYAYLPINPEWPANFMYWDQPGYEAEFVHVVSAMERHFREKGWTRTRLEMFFNHKKRYKGFPWDGDEVRFTRDNEYFRRFGALLRRSVPADSPVKFVFRNDASWAMEQQFRDLKGVVDHWVLSRGILSFYPHAPKMLRDRGDTVWFYSSAVAVTEPSYATLYNPLRAWMWGVDGYVLWLVTGSGPDPWFRHNGGRETMVYPGWKFGLPGPIPSIRLKIQRNALQDLALLKALEPRYGRDRLEREIARLTGGHRPEDWWTVPRPALADRPTEEWTNADIAEASRPSLRVEEGLTSDWWPEIRRWIYLATLQGLPE